MKEIKQKTQQKKKSALGLVKIENQIFT